MSHTSQVILYHLFTTVILATAAKTNVYFINDETANQIFVYITFPSLH